MSIRYTLRGAVQPNRPTRGYRPRTPVRGLSRRLDHHCRNQNGCRLTGLYGALDQRRASGDSKLAAPIMRDSGRQKCVTGVPSRIPRWGCGGIIFARSGQSIIGEEVGVNVPLRTHIGRNVARKLRLDSSRRGDDRFEVPGGDRLDLDLCTDLSRHFINGERYPGAYQDHEHQRQQDPLLHILPL